MYGARCISTSKDRHSCDQSGSSSSCGQQQSFRNGFNRLSDRNIIRSPCAGAARGCVLLASSQHPLRERPYVGFRKYQSRVGTQSHPFEANSSKKSFDSNTRSCKIKHLIDIKERKSNTR